LIYGFAKDLPNPADLPQLVVPLSKLELPFLRVA
jgi:hypothetical protein